MFDRSACGQCAPISGSGAPHTYPDLTTGPEWGDALRSKPTLCEYFDFRPFSYSFVSSCGSECGKMYIQWVVVWASGGVYLPAGGTPEEVRDGP